MFQPPRSLVARRYPAMMDPQLRPLASAKKGKASAKKGKAPTKPKGPRSVLSADSALASLIVLDQDGAVFKDVGDGVPAIGRRPRLSSRPGWSAPGRPGQKDCQRVLPPTREVKAAV